jgi:hypothetical protein
LQPGSGTKDRFRFDSDWDCIKNRKDLSSQVKPHIYIFGGGKEKKNYVTAYRKDNKMLTLAWEDKRMVSMLRIWHKDMEEYKSKRRKNVSWHPETHGNK